MKLAIVATLLAIISSLGLAAFQLFGRKKPTKKLIHTLSLRVALSISLFIALIVMYKTGHYLR